MNKIFLGALAVVVLASSAFATPTACAPDTLDHYLLLPFIGGCMINSATFDQWSYKSATIAASSIEVTPITTPGNEGFDFNGFWGVTGDGSAVVTQDSTIGFTASGVGFTDLSLSLLGAASGTGVADVTEQYCFNHAVSNCPSGAQNGGQLSVTNPPPNFSDVLFMSPQSSISVLKDIGVSSGTGVGKATISQVTNQFSSPEPLSFVLLGSGLLGLGLMRRRIKR